MDLKLPIMLQALSPCHTKLHCKEPTLQLFEKSRASNPSVMGWPVQVHSWAGCME